MIPEQFHHPVWLWWRKNWPFLAVTVAVYALLSLLTRPNAPPPTKGPLP